MYTINVQVICRIIYQRKWRINEYIIGDKNYHSQCMTTLHNLRQSPLYLAVIKCTYKSNSDLRMGTIQDYVKLLPPINENFNADYVLTNKTFALINEAIYCRNV